MSIEIVLALVSALISTITVLAGLRFYLRFGRKRAGIGWLILLLATILIAFSELGDAVLVLNKVTALVPDILGILAEFTLLIAFLRMFNVEFATLTNQLESAKKLAQTSEYLAASLDPGDVLRHILSQALILVNADLGAIYPLDETDQAALEHVVFLRRTSAEVRETIHPAIDLTQQIIQSRQPQYIEDLDSFKMTPSDFKPSTLVSLTGLPLIHGGKVKGVLFIGFDQRHEFSVYERQLLVLFTSQVALAVHNAELYHEVKELSITDSLTGLANRREFERSLARELMSARRYGKSLSLLILDLDHFKQINDTWGHPAGDAVLVAVANCLRENARNIDLPARMGGEEIALLLPETDVNGAVIIAERIRQTIANKPVNWQENIIHITCSVGVAGGYGEGLPFEPEKLYQQSDNALYRAKESGRDQVKTFIKEVG